MYYILAKINSNYNLNCLNEFSFKSLNFEIMNKK